MFEILDGQKSAIPLFIEKTKNYCCTLCHLHSSWPFAMCCIHRYLSPIVVTVEAENVFSPQTESLTKLIIVKSSYEDGNSATMSLMESRLISLTNFRVIPKHAIG